jgi:hypothetical protein
LADDAQDDDAVVEDAAAGAVKGLAESRGWQAVVELELELEGSLALSAAVPRRRKCKALNKRPLSNTMGMTAAGINVLWYRTSQGMLS